MNLSVSLAFILSVLTSLSLAGCGGGSSGGSDGVPESGAGGSTSLNRGMTGTLYYERGFQLEALDIATGQVRIRRVESPRLSGYSTSADSSLHTSAENFRAASSALDLSQAVVVADDGGREIYTFDLLGDAQTEPLISFDNQYIAIILMEKRDPQIRGLHILTTDGQPVRFIPDSDELKFADIAFNENGALMVSFTRKGLYFMPNPLVDEPRLLRETPGFTMVDMTVSPDGESIAYVKAEDRQLYMLDAGSSEPRQMTYATESLKMLGGIDWSPDGRYLVMNYFFSDRSCAHSRMLMIDATAEMERLPLNNEEVRTSSSSAKIFPVEAYLPSESGPLLTILSCVGDPSWR